MAARKIPSSQAAAAGNKKLPPGSGTGLKQKENCRAWTLRNCFGAPGFLVVVRRDCRVVTRKKNRRDSAPRSGREKKLGMAAGSGHERKSPGLDAPGFLVCPGISRRPRLPGLPRRKNLPAVKEGNRRAWTLQDCFNAPGLLDRYRLGIALTSS